MVDRRSTAQVAIQAKERPEIVAARDELATLDKLSQGLATKISELVRERPHFDRKSSTAEFGVHQVKYSSLKGYEELAHHCYGRTVLGHEIAADGRSQGRFTYRITQATVGYVDDGCYVLARNSPIASKLVTSIPGDESEISAPKRTRFLTVEEIRTFDGPVSLLSRTQKPNFRSMLVWLAGESEPLILQNIRAFLHGLAGQHSNGAITSTATPALSETHVGEPVTSDIDQTFLELVYREVHHDPTWLQSWQGVYLSDSETSSLGHQFFTRTTPEQESALNNPHGLTFVEGIAGAGKTSVALGRLKFFANFATGEQREHYGLKNCVPSDFSPVDMVGFVLSHSLKRYLKETAISLGLDRLPIRDFQEFPIRDFQEFRTDLSNKYGLAKKFKRTKSEVLSHRTRLSWLHAVDTAVARVVGIRLQEVVSRNLDIPLPVREAVLKISTELTSTEVRADQTRFHLEGLAHRVISHVMDVEFRTREASIRERMNRETLRNIKVHLERALTRVRQEEERSDPLTFSATASCGFCCRRPDSTRRSAPGVPKIRSASIWGPL